MSKRKDEDKGKDQDKEKGKKNTSLRLDPKTLKALKIAAAEEGVSIQHIVEKLVIDYLNKRKK